MTQKCPSCGGTGEYNTDQCPICGGTGRVSVRLARQHEARAQVLDQLAAYDQEIGI